MGKRSGQNTEGQESEPHVCNLMKAQNVVEEGGGEGSGKGRFGSDDRVINAMWKVAFIGYAVSESNCVSDNSVLASR